MRVCICQVHITISDIHYIVASPGKGRTHALAKNTHPVCHYNVDMYHTRSRRELLTLNCGRWANISVVCDTGSGGGGSFLGTVAPRLDALASSPGAAPLAVRKLVLLLREKKAYW